MSKKTPPATDSRVGVSLGRTINLGDFESIRIDVSFEQDTTADNMVGVHADLIALAHTKLAEQEQIAREQKNPPPAVSVPPADFVPDSTPAAPAAPVNLGVQGATLTPNTPPVAEGAQGGAPVITSAMTEAATPGVAPDAPAETTPVKKKAKRAKKAAKVATDNFVFNRPMMSAVLMELARHPNGGEDKAVGLLRTVSGDAAATVETVKDEALQVVAVSALRALTEAYIGHSLTVEQVQEIINTHNISGVAWESLQDGKMLMDIVNTCKNYKAQVGQETAAPVATAPAPTAAAPVAQTPTPTPAAAQPQVGVDRNALLTQATELDALDRGKLLEMLSQVAGVQTVNDVPDTAVNQLIQAISVEVGRIKFEREQAAQATAAAPASPLS